MENTRTREYVHLGWGVVMLALALLAVAIAGCGKGKTVVNRMSGRSFVLNQDSRDICWMAPPGNAQEWIREWYRRAFAAGVSVFVADVAQPDMVVTKDTPTGEIVGARGPASGDDMERRYRVIKELMGQNTDLLHLLCDEGRKARALVLAGMRMSDAHHGGRWKPTSDNLLFPKFAMDHPEWCNTWEDGSLDVTLNYSIPEVQAHRLQILRELVTNYDVDGVELDWMRHCRHFPAGRQREYLNVLTDFVGQVRRMLDEVAQKKGVERMILGHRVPVTVEECLNIGCDVETWAKKGYAEFLAPMDFLQYDPIVRTDEFVKATRGTGCLVYPGFGSRRYSFGNWYQPRGQGQRRTAVLSNLDQFRAAAANWFAWGAAGGSSYNMIAWPPEQQEFFAGAISIMSDRGKALAGPRHYLYVPTWKDHVPMDVRIKKYGDRFTDWTPGAGVPGVPRPLSTGYIQVTGTEEEGSGVAPTGRLNAQSLVFSAENVGVRQAFAFRMADGRNGEKLQGWLRLRIYDASPEDKFSIDLNGQAIPIEKFKIDHLPGGELSGRTDKDVRLPDDGTFDWPPNLRLEISLADCPPFRGDNELGTTFLRKDPAGAKKLVIEALEVLVR